MKYVFLTRADSDHTGRLNLFKNAELCVPADEELMVNKTTPRFFGFGCIPPLERAYKLLKDGDTIQAGEAKVTATATPGHAPGSMSYLVNDSILVVGDTLTLRKGKVCPISRLQLKSLLGMDLIAQTKSIKKLAALTNISVMVTAHTRFTTDLAVHSIHSLLNLSHQERYEN